MKYIKFCGGKKIDERMPDLTNKTAGAQEAWEKFVLTAWETTSLIALKDSAENSNKE